MNNLIENIVCNYYESLNESRQDKLAINFLKSKGVTDYNEQMKIIGALKHDIPNIREGKGKFVLGGLRCYYDRQLSDAGNISAFDKALGYIFKGGHQDDYDENLNNLSVNELTEIFKDIIKLDLESDKERSNKRNFEGESDYEIIPINSYADAKKYGKYTSWCVTQAQQHFNSYVCNNAKRFYFCLKKGFENVKKNAGSDVPLDEYGLSMISVLIDNIDGGSVDRITTRWNHEHNGENNKALCTAEQLEDILNVPFYKTFIPYTKDELHKMGVVLFEDVQDMLDAGIHPKKIFDEVEKYTNNGCALVKLHGKYNFITRKRELLFSKWYYGLFSFYGDYAYCWKEGNWSNGKGNFIDKNEKFLFDTWYTYEEHIFTNGMAKLKNEEGLNNFIDINGKLLFRNWYSIPEPFIGNYIKIENGKGQFNYIDKNEKILNDDWYSYIEYYQAYNVFKVKADNEQYNLLNMQGEALLPEWYDNVLFMSKDKIRVRKDGKQMCMTFDGTPIFKEAYDQIQDFDMSAGLILVANKTNNSNKEKWSIVGPDGERINDDWYDYISGDKDCIIVEKNNKKNILKLDGSLMFTEWYDEVTKPSTLLYIDKSGNHDIKETVDLIYVSNNGKCNYIDTNNKLVSNEWFDACYEFVNGFAKVERNNKMNFIDNNGKLLSDKWFDKGCSFLLGGDYTIVFEGNGQKMNIDRNSRMYMIYGMYGGYANGQMEDDPFSNEEKYMLRIAKYISQSGDKRDLSHIVRYIHEIDKFLENQGYKPYLLGSDGKLYKFDANAIKENDYNFNRDKISIDNMQDINENKLIESVVNNYYESLNESRADKLAIKFLKSKGVTDYNEQMKIIGTLKHDIPNIKGCKGKFVLAGLRYLYNGQLDNAQKIMTFDKALGYIFKGNHQDDYDENFNGLSIDELTEKYKDIAKGDLNVDMQRSNNKQFKNESDYTIIPIENYRHASKYKNYTEWCVTHDKEAFDSYTSKGMKRFYFCLQNGFESIQKHTGQNAPLDEYGLSMISVLVDNMDGGSLDRITTRWNHDYNGENNKDLCTVEQLENIINLPFYKTFIPYTNDELMKKGIVPFDMVQDMLDSGKMPKQIFDDVTDFVEGYAMVILHEKHNFIDKANKLLSDKWFEYAEIFSENCAVIQLNDKYNFIDKDGNYLLDKWYDHTYSFFEGYAVVQLNNKWNYIDKDGKYLTDKWFEYAERFSDGCACIKLNNKWNFIDKSSNYIFDDWFDRTNGFNNGYAMVKIKGKWNFVDKNYSMLSDINFDFIHPFYDGFAEVMLNNKWNLIDENGHLIFNDWLDIICPYSDKYKIVILNGKYNFIDKKCKLMFDVWFDYMFGFDGKHVLVKLNGKYNYLNKNEKIMSDIWFDHVDDFYKGYAKVMLDNKYNFINENGKLLFDIWFDTLNDFKGGYANATLNGKSYIIDTAGKITEK